MAEARPVFGYWNIRAGPRGNINRHLLNYIGVDFGDRRFEREPENTWAAEKENFGAPFPNIPYIQDGDFKLTESKAVSVYICDRWDPTLMGANAAERGQVIMLQCVITDFGMGVLGPAFAQTELEPCI